MKIPFDIKFRPQIESGEYKLSFDGKPARIICWDKKRSKGNATLVALIDDGESEHTEYFFSDGLAICATAPALYIITPEPELSGFEKRLFEIRHIAKRDMYSDEEWQTLRGEAAELLELAKDEIYSHESLVEYAKKAKEEGKSEALKNLPRWKNAVGYCFVGPSIMYDVLGFYKSSTTKPGCRYITHESLRMLPGFNE